MPKESLITEYVREMTHIFRAHARQGGPGEIGSLTLDQAYAVQDGFVAERMQTQGRVVGWKVGCTSEAIRRQFGLKQPISGRLFEKELSVDGVELRISDYVDCAVEPELYFRLGQDLDGSPSDEEIVKAISGVGPGIEMHNYRFWYGKPTSQELIATNGIHAGFVLGKEIPWPQNFAINDEEISILVNGVLKASAKCSEIMNEGPLASVRWLVKHARERGRHLRAGELIIPGSAVQLVHVFAGDAVEARFARLGSCHARMV